MVGVDQVLEKLATVIDPDLKKDIVSMGMIKDLELNSGDLKFTLELTTPACPFNDEIEADVRKAIDELDDIKNFDMKVTAKVMEGRSLDADESMATVKNVIGVASGKGGVGKSTVSLNLAIALSQTGAKVGLLDADIYGPNTPTMLGVGDRTPEVKGSGAEQQIIPIESCGVAMVSMGLLIDENQPVIWRGPMLNGIIRQFLYQTLWGVRDILIVDLPPGTGDAQLSLAQSVPMAGVLIVTTPQKVSLQDARRGLAMFQQMQVPVLGVVENMSSFVPPDFPNKSYPLFGEGGGQQLADENDVPLLAKIPMEMPVQQGGNQGQPIVQSRPDSLSSKAFLSLARSVLAHISDQT